jgi:hypothetical protein
MMNQFIVKEGLFYFQEISKEKADELIAIAKEKGILVECSGEEVEYNINDGILVKQGDKFYFSKYAGDI